MTAPSEHAAARHTEVVDAFRKANAAKHRAAMVLTAFLDDGLHLELGYRDLDDYAVRALDMSSRDAHAMVAICRSRSRFPTMVQAVADGTLAWTKAREMMRVIVPETEAAWVERARTVTSRVLERDVSASRMGDAPPELGRTKDPAVTELRIRGATAYVDLLREYFRWARAMANVGREDVDDAELLALLAQKAMAEAEDSVAPTAQRYRIIVEHCPSCGRTEGVDAELPDTLADMARCDAEVIEMRPGPERGHHSHTVPPATRRAVLARDRYACRVPGCRNRLYLEVHHVVFREDGGSHRESNLISLCSTHHHQLHEGYLAIEARNGGWTFRFGDGQEAWAPTDSRMAPTWVSVGERLSLPTTNASPETVVRGGLPASPREGPMPRA